MNVPPPIQNQGTPCPNCGAFRPGGQAYCANCGYGLPPQAGRASNTAQLVWVVLFILIGLPAACMGGCFVLLSAGSARTSADFSILLFGIGGLVVFLGLLAMVIRSSRRRS